MSSTVDPRWKRFHDWRRRVFIEWHPELPEGITRDKCLLVASIVADSGDAGTGCWISDTKIAEQMECDRHTVARYRKYLIGANVFSLTGGSHGRVKDLDIGMPEAVAKTAGAVRVSRLPSPAPKREPEPVPAAVRVIAEHSAPSAVDIHICKRDPWAYDGDVTCAVCGRVIPALAGGTEVFGEVPCREAA